MSKKFEKHLKELDTFTEGILDSIKDAAKGFVSGIKGNSFDAEDESVKRDVNKKLKKYASQGGSDKMVGAINKLNKKQPFYIGKNKILNISDELLPFLFSYDEKGNYKLIYDFNEDKFKIRWLLDGSYEAKNLSLSKTYTNGPVKGRDIYFVGIWKSGDFKGVMGKNSIITGGYIVDGIYAAKSVGFKIPPYNLISKGYVILGDKIMGLPIVEPNKKYKSLSIYQVRKGDKIKIIDNNDKEHVITVDKNFTEKSLDISINGTVINWDNYNRSRSNFMKSVMKIGNSFSIPNIIDVNDGIQSIEVKTSQYKSKESVKSKESAKSNEVIKFPNPVKGWGATVPDGYKLDTSILGDDEVMNKVERFISDSESGKFEKYLNFFKKLIEQGRVDGYGKYPALRYLWKEKGQTYKEEDKKRDATLKYFSDFSENIIDNFKSNKVEKYYENKMSQFLGLSSKKVKSKKQKKSSSSKQNFTKKVGKALGESKMSIKNIVYESIINS